MNKAITDGITLTPPPFANGLDVWSSGNGTPGSDTYDGAVNAALVAADQDFGDCLELQKTSNTQKLRYMGDTPMFAGCYFRISARVKAISGNLPDVRIAAWAGDGSASHVTGLTETGPEVTLTTYGDVVEVSAIVGSGARGGVDMVWGTEPVFGHFGLDLTGPTGGIVRIDDIQIEDVTEAFLRNMLNFVDVRDFGAVGDGVSDDSAAFAAADAAAGRRMVQVPEGTYFLGSDVTFSTEVEFHGTVTMPTDKMLVLQKNFDLPSYIDAFGDEELAFRKAFQAMLNNADHESLDMGGRKVTVTGPIDMAAAAPGKASFETRRVIRNGQLDASGGAAWDTEVVTSQATYDPGDSRKLTGVSNVANVPLGALVEGNGVGREIYVKDKNEAAQEITLNAPLYDAAGTQNFTFSRFKYMLDFSGFSKLSKFGLSNMEIQCNSKCSAIMLAPKGLIFSVSDCFISRPKDRGITSIGDGCQGMLIDQCQFLSSEDALDVPDRTSIALNANKNDVKLRNCRATKFRHFAFLAGANSVVMGNHFFQGDGVSSGVRTAGIVFAENYTSASFTGNYVDNCFIEWTNERDPTPAFSSGFSFSAMTITDNVFLSGDVAPWFSYIVIKPHGAGHFLNGVMITGNKFRSINGNIDRAESVDTSFADLDFSRAKDVHFHSNSFHGIDQKAQNPARVHHTEASAAQTWSIGTDNQLPFGGWARRVDGVVAQGKIQTGGNVTRHEMPYVEVQQGSQKNKISVVWSEALKGDVSVNVRMDN